jgi:uncharacterized protein
MTSQEMQALQTFLAQLTQARADAKDPQAESLIADAVSRQPDAAYLLVQRAMLLDQALTSAKAQISALQSQLQAAQSTGTIHFLDPASNLGNSANRVATSPIAPPLMPTSASVPAPPQNAAVQPSRPGFLSGGLGSTLSSIATTAAGVAGGAFLFQGIENLLHQHNGSSFWGQPAMGALPTETTVINNYYGNDGVSSHDVSKPALDASFLDDGLNSDDIFNDDSSII